MMKQRIIYFLFILCGLTSCTEELLYENTNPGEGYSNVTFTMSFHPETSVSLGTRAAKGDAIKNIENLFIIFYDLEGNYTGTHYYIKNPKTEDVDRDTLAEKLPTTEPKTVQTTCTCKNVPFGVYRIYAVANMGDLAENEEYKDQIKTETDFKKIRFNWNSAIKSNAQMSGYFTADEEYKRYEEGDYRGDYRREAVNVTIDKTIKTLHAWLRRAVSKVTVDYDATDLREGIKIHLKSVKLVNRPASCSLVDRNTPTGEEITVVGEKMKDLLSDDDEIVYGKKENGEEEETVSADAYILAKGHPHIDGHENIHDNNSLAMFFYENMQGKGEEGTVSDKRQQVLNDQEAIDEHRPSYPHGTEEEKGEGYRDGKMNGTYVEVDAYYVSNATGNVGRGPIKYRFMLGKDTKIDYNAERNHHYKLTLKFNGNANDVDWHIEYDEEDTPGIYMPDYYVSYSYNQPYIDYGTSNNGISIEDNNNSYWEKCYPIRLSGKTIGETLTVQIIENNWGPSGSSDELKTLTYYNPDNEGPVLTSKTEGNTTSYPALSTALDYSGVWHGFLSLYKQEGKAILRTDADGKEWGRYGAGEYIYWYNRGNPYTTKLKEKSTPVKRDEEFLYGEGFRTFKTTLDNNQEVGEQVYEDEKGTYKVVKSVKNGLQETTVYIPLFTRPLVINQKKGFSGNNPYFSFQRTAKLRVTTDIGMNIDDDIDDIKTKKYTKEATVNQVRRIINPRGVFRSYDNDAAFDMTLMYRTDEGPGTDFVSFLSEGAWRASIVGGEGWHLEKNNINYGNKVSGSTNSHVSFTVKPDKKLTDPRETRCALVRVEYHDYHCVHYVHLRQGYAPLSLDDGKTYWHSFNVKYTERTQAYETDCELDEGSMFRYGNLTQAIDAINNTFDDRFNDINDAHFTINGTKKFILAPINATEATKEEQYASWDEITPKATFENKNNLTVDGVECRMPLYEDFNRLRTESNADLDISLGICYGDEATSNAQEDEYAFTYSRYARKGAPEWLSYKPKETGTDPSGRAGVRGCFVYNHVNGGVIFLPLGAGSHGRRKTNGLMRYGDTDVLFTAYNATNARYVPCLYNLREQYGAIYWLGEPYYKITNDDNPAVAWDINYSSIDFNPIFIESLWHKRDINNYPNSDAVYIRLVQDEKPTLEQCKAIDRRVKAYQRDKWW